jgi:HIUase/Transthyretin family
MRGRRGGRRSAVAIECFGARSFSTFEARRERSLAGLTTHVLDVTSGRPADGVRVELYELVGGSERKPVVDVVTNSDGRLRQVRARLPSRGLFPPPTDRASRPAVPRDNPNPLRRRRSHGALSHAPPRLAMELFDLPGKLMAAQVPPRHRAATSVRLTRLHFLGPSPFRLETPAKMC